MNYKLHEPHPLAGRTITERQVRSLWTQGQICQDDILEEVIDTSSEMAILGTATTPERFTGERLVELCENVESHGNQEVTIAKWLPRHLMASIRIRDVGSVEKSMLNRLRRQSLYKGMHYTSSVIGVLGLLFGTIVLAMFMQIAWIPAWWCFILASCYVLDTLADIADLGHLIYRGLQDD